MTKKEKKNVEISKERLELIQNTCYDICKDCALKNGAKWPYDDYICTMWHGKCDVCQEHRVCSAIRDWKWPDKKWEWID
jgi:hypothetical protein